MTLKQIRRSNLQAVIDRRFGGVQTRFASAVGRQGDYVSRLVTGRKSLGEKLAREIEAILGMTPGELDQPAAPAVAVSAVQNHFQLGGTVPILRWDQLVLDDHGTMSAQHAQAAQVATQFAPRPSGMSDNAYALPVQGPAMEPEFREGWLVYVDPDTVAQHGDFVVARLEGRAVPILRQLVMEGGVSYLRATNPTQPEPLVPLAAGQILGRVIYQGRIY